MIQTTATPEEYKRGAERMATIGTNGPSEGRRDPGSAEEGARGAGPLMSGAGGAAVRSTSIERISLWLSSVCLIGMVLLILVEIVLRGVFNSTTEHSRRAGRLPAGRHLTFLSAWRLCQSRGAFHRVEMVQMRLGPRGKAVSALVFDLLSFGYVALTGWYFMQFVMSSYRREAMASTVLATPCGSRRRRWSWARRLLLIVLGTHDRRRRPEARRHDADARSPASSWSIFLGLLAAGMAIPVRHRRAGDRLSAAAWRRRRRSRASA